MERYDSYKDSGVKWLGEIPSHWDSASLLYLLRAKISDGPHETPNLIEDGIPFISIDSLNDTKEIDFSVVKKFISYKDYERYCYKTKLENGDVLFSKAATIGKTAIVGNDVFMVWSPLAILKPNFDKISSLYLYYIMNCKKAIDEVSLSGSKNTQINVGMRELEKIRIPIPTIEEQNIITHFLEKETSKIDEAIAQQQKMIDLLNERKQIIINNAVTKGLDPSVPLKDSGIDWIGKIPAHWEVVRLKYLLSESKERSLSGNEEPLSMSQIYGLIPTKEMNIIPNMASSFVGAKIVRKGDLVFNKLKAHLGVFNVSRYNGLVSPDYAVYSSTGRVNLAFLEYIFKTPKCIHEFIKLITGVGAGLSRLYTSDLYSIYCAIPSIEEQTKICKFIEERTSNIRNAIINCQKQISLLQERKQIIINDVVTGKVKIV